MKKWHFKTKNSPKTIGQSMENALNSVNGLVFNMKKGENDSVMFNFRKRILYPWYLFFLNSLVVRGKLTKSETDYETHVEISFKQHFLWVLVIFTNMIVGLAVLIAVISEKNSSTYVYLIGGLIITIGIILWIRIQKKYVANIQEYKDLISKIFGV
ncbi:DUF423 domain-containing protein [Flavobacteriaceae bacterium GSB9]|nr:DUF423 domain-containing protein [Flavobacteriaceae bacterium GSB9]